MSVEFRLPHPASHAGGKWTEYAAAGLIAPYQKTIALRVLYWLREYGEEGLIDDEMRVLMRGLGPETLTRADSSERSRRNEVVRAGYAEDSGKVRLNRRGNPEVVWRITELGKTGPWPVKKKKGDSAGIVKPEEEGEEIKMEEADPGEEVEM